MKLEMIKSKKGSYKIISHCNRKDPALKHLAQLLKEANKRSDIKMGVFMVPQEPFSTYKKVYSYIKQTEEKMNKLAFYKWIKGERSMKPKKNWEEDWKPVSANKE